MHCTSITYAAVCFPSGWYTWQTDRIQSGVCPCSWAPGDIQDIPLVEHQTEKVHSYLKDFKVFEPFNQSSFFKLSHYRHDCQKNVHRIMLSAEGFF